MLSLLKCQKESRLVTYVTHKNAFLLGSRIEKTYVSSRTARLWKGTYIPGKYSFLYQTQMEAEYVSADFNHIHIQAHFKQTWS